MLDKLVRDELPGSDDDASALDELVALARAQCQLHHDADRNAVAVIPMPSRREVWRVYSSGFEDWLCAAYWRAKEMGVPETTMKSALATLAAAGINDGESHEGWIAVADDYDDGGFSGGNMERPALKRLMADIQMGKVDIVVVYKIDRLSRSLADFARMVDVFDRHRVSFSAVTQQINSATSMARLMLNVLLSFAQFEREVTGERIRDKIAASKAKGMWMGGPLPLGYDVRDRLLVINETEAALVRRIFHDFVTLRSATLMAKAYGAQGVVTKGGKPFTKQTIYKMLHNRMYLGEIVHKGQSFPGQH